MAVHAIRAAQQARAASRRLMASVAGRQPSHSSERGKSGMRLVAGSLAGLVGASVVLATAPEEAFLGVGMPSVVSLRVAGAIARRSGETNLPSVIGAPVRAVADEVVVLLRKLAGMQASPPRASQEAALAVLEAFQTLPVEKRLSFPRFALLNVVKTATSDHESAVAGIAFQVAEQCMRAASPGPTRTPRPWEWLQAPPGGDGDAPKGDDGWRLLGAWSSDPRAAEAPKASQNIQWPAHRSREESLAAQIWENACEAALRPAGDSAGAARLLHRARQRCAQAGGGAALRRSAATSAGGGAESVLRLLGVLRATLDDEGARTTERLADAGAVLCRLQGELAAAAPQEEAAQAGEALVRVASAALARARSGECPDSAFQKLSLAAEALSAAESCGSSKDAARAGWVGMAGIASGLLASAESVRWGGLAALVEGVGGCTEAESASEELCRAVIAAGAAGHIGKLPWEAGRAAARAVAAATEMTLLQLPSQADAGVQLRTVETALVGLGCLAELAARDSGGEGGGEWAGVASRALRRIAADSGGEGAWLPAQLVLLSALATLSGTLHPQSRAGMLLELRSLPWLHRPLLRRTRPCAALPAAVMALHRDGAPRGWLSLQAVWSAPEPPSAPPGSAAAVLVCPGGPISPGALAALSSPAVTAKLLAGLCEAVSDAHNAPSAETGAAGARAAAAVLGTGLVPMLLAAASVWPAPAGEAAGMPDAVCLCVSAASALSGLCGEAAGAAIRASETIGASALAAATSGSPVSRCLAQRVLVNAGLEVRVSAEAGGWRVSLQQRAGGAGPVMDNLVFPLADLSSYSPYQPVTAAGEAGRGWERLAQAAVGVAPASRGSGGSEDDSSASAPTVGAADAWAEADVVLVHGIDGTGLSTWRAVPSPLPSLQHARHAANEEALARLRGALAATQGGLPSHLLNVAADDSRKRAMWPISWLAPKLLLERRVAPRIVSVEYDARPYAGLTARADLCIEETAAAVGRSLARAQIGANGRPVLFVCHSMGGLVVKAMLRQRAGMAPQSAGADGQLGQCVPSWLTGDVSIMFLATPHRGSQVSEFAKELETAGLVRVSPALKLMKPGHPYLLDLNEDFIDLVKSPPLVDGRPTLRVRRIRSFAEGREWWLPAPASSVAIVSPQSADPGIGSFEIIPEADHLSINKPDGPHSRLLEDVAQMVG